MKEEDKMNQPGMKVEEFMFSDFSHSRIIVTDEVLLQYNNLTQNQLSDLLLYLK